MNERLRLPADGELVDPIQVMIDGQPHAALPGDTVAGVLYAAGIRAWRRARPGDVRGLLCGMGICYDCLVTVDGRPDQRACQVLAQDGMQVTTTLAQPGEPDWRR